MVIVIKISLNELRKMKYFGKVIVLNKKGHMNYTKPKNNFLLFYEFILKALTHNFIFNDNFLIVAVII